MTQAFSTKADFSGMLSGPAAKDLYISDVFHKVLHKHVGSSSCGVLQLFLEIRNTPFLTVTNPSQIFKLLLSSLLKTEYACLHLQN